MKDKKLLLRAQDNFGNTQTEKDLLQGKLKNIAITVQLPKDEKNSFYACARTFFVSPYLGTQYGARSYQGNKDREAELLRLHIFNN